ncbi:EmrB/QacA subfamily drug resistance transporter [Actinoplanes octamycinicus]|uniref:EmrB/QacA subfamily drug resistance transporter n=1 Tax=Actinoplanes octamycinicus TaxID=135948 RepID=A0A7W7MCD0_9ACTN|nr:MFS transporter [Actinoplanes octamycinicus]MBB4744976.1 EmrB/QacA subfamily drug resistance transporter [Actinoplanes octamycinicus]GIE55562.1 MFS transporter [Actinoplanes octamycinicus]
MPRLYQATSDRQPAPRVTFAVLAAAAAAFALMQSLVTPVLPTIQQDLHTTAGTVTWVLTAWLLAASVATPLMGRIADTIGKDRTLLVALGAIALGCLLAAIAPTVTVLIVARVVQGLGAAVFPVSFGIIRDVYPPHRVSSAIGVLAAVIASGSGLGIVLAGPIVGWLDWRWLFWIPMVAVTLVAVVAWRVIPASPPGPRGRINWLSAVLLAGWLVALLLPLSKGATWGWTTGRTVGLFALAVVFFAGWMVSELRSAEPLIDMRMMRLPAVWTTNLVSLLFGAAMFGVFAFLPQLMQVPSSTGYGFGASVTTAGLLMLPMMVTMAVSGSISGPLTRWVGNKAQLLIGAGLGTAGALSLALAHDSRAVVAVTGAVFGIGLGLLYSSMINLIVQSVPRHQTGTASGMNTNIRTIGASIGTAIVSSVVTGHPGPQGLPAESGYTEAFLLLAVASAAAFLVALLVPAKRATTPAPAPAALPELTPVEA